MTVEEVRMELVALIHRAKKSGIVIKVPTYGFWPGELWTADELTAESVTRPDEPALVIERECAAKPKEEK